MIWNVKSGKLIRRFEADSSIVNCVQVLFYSFITNSLILLISVLLLQVLIQLFIFLNQDMLVKKHLKICRFI